MTQKENISVQSRISGVLLLRGYIECYRFYSFSETVSGYTIANGRLDACIILQGGISLLKENGTVLGFPKLGFFPLSGQLSHLRIEKNTRVLNLKFYPHVLAHHVFDGNSFKGPSDFEEIFDSSALLVLQQQLSAASGFKEMVEAIDQFLAGTLLQNPADKEDSTGRLISFFEKDPESTITLDEVAMELGKSSKTLERHFKKCTGLSIQFYRSLVRFQHAARKINAQGEYAHGNLAEALSMGYYDQSHFVKACRRITGYKPRDLFAALPASVTDFVVFD